MPNLLKSLPREILEKEDSQFIYNVLNPLLFDKVKETLSDTTVSHKVSSLFDKDIHFPKQFTPEFILPFNINTREFNVYMTDNQENIKLDFFGSVELVKDLDDLKSYIFFYFGVENYEFLYDIMKHFYNIKNENDISKRNYEYNYSQYLIEPDSRKKKIYKSTYQFFKKTYDKFKDLKQQFDLIIGEADNYNDFSAKQMVDNIAKTIGNYLQIKTFDNELVFEKCVLFEYLTDLIKVPSKVKKHHFKGKVILQTDEFEVSNIFELIACFSMELSTMFEKYELYLKTLVDNGNGFSLDVSENKVLKNKVNKNVNLTIDSDNLTYLFDDVENKLNIYVYFSKLLRIEEQTFDLKINGETISKSLHSLNGYQNFGYSLFEYFDDTNKYYKITVNDFLCKNIDDTYETLEINSIEILTNLVEATFNDSNFIKGVYFDSIGFLDNFVLYAKNTQTGFYEKLDIPYKVKISNVDREERFIRLYEIEGINETAQRFLLSKDDVLVGCFEYDYVYEPKVYVDFFKYMDSEVSFRYNTILPYVLIDEVFDSPFEIEYFSEISMIDYSLNVEKNVVMFDGITYRKLYDDINYLRILNPYNESGYEFVSRISVSTFNSRNHTNPTIITEKIKQVQFKENLRMFDKIQVDFERGLIILMHRGVQKSIPVAEGLHRGLHIEKFALDYESRKIRYANCDICNTHFAFTKDEIYIFNPKTSHFDLAEATPTEQFNLTGVEKQIFFDIHEMSHCVIFENIKYKVDGLYIDTFKNAFKSSENVMFVEANSGIPRFKSGDLILDVDFHNKIEKNNYQNGSISFNSEDKTLIYHYAGGKKYYMQLSVLNVSTPKHRQLGMWANSIFYAGNIIPENSNKAFVGRENIFNSMFLTDTLYDIGKNRDNYNDKQSHELLAEQLDLVYTDASKFNLEQEQYIMMKSRTSSFKGLESYLRASLKVVSNKINVSPVYLIQRNRFISEWAKVSSVQFDSYYAENSLKELVADLMETKLINNKYDDLIDIFKNNEYENFSIDTNNIHSILIQYILRYLDSEQLLENFSYYLIHEVWIKKTRKKITDFINANATQQIVREVAEMKFETAYEREKFFYIFVNTLFSLKKETISSYIPLANYSDWKSYQENNEVHFEKPYRYEWIDISDFITMPVAWDQPLVMIRPLTEDHVFVKRDFRFLDLSIITNSQVTQNDAYNEYVEKIKNTFDTPVNFLYETLSVLNDLSISEGFDLFGVNLVIVKWITERFIPNYLSTNAVDTVEEFRDIIRKELTSSEHPNNVVTYNKIKESTLLGDLGENVSNMFDTITSANLVATDVIRLTISSSTELEYLDKIKRPLEHYFDYLFFAKRHDLVAKILALFTEDVIASSMLDLSMAINLKHSKGDETFAIYERMVYDIFDEYLPFHSVLDKLIFVFNAMESTSSEAMGKELATTVMDLHLIDITMDFIEKVRIQTFDRGIFTTSLYFPSIGMRLCGAGYDDQPYDYDRTIQVAGYDLVGHDDESEFYGVDDEFYVLNKESRFKHRVSDVYVPPQFAEYLGECGPSEQVVESYIYEYYQIRMDMSFGRPESIFSHFVDTLPEIDVSTDITESPLIGLVEDYLIHIETIFKVEFYDYFTSAHDSIGYGDVSSPEGQISLIGMHDAMRQNILHDFYDKLHVTLIDSVWSYIAIVYDMVDIPGHDEFGIDENYHQRSPFKLEHDMSVMVYDPLLKTVLEQNYVDMSDVSIVNEKLISQVFVDYKRLKLDVVSNESMHVTIGMIMNRNFDADGHFLRPGHDEFVYDEDYHNSVNDDRANNMADVLITDYQGHVRIDFGFMRMLPFDPYAELINQKFYRKNLPGSELEHTTIRDRYLANIHTFGKDIIRISMLDFHALDFIHHDERRQIYIDIEKESHDGDLSVAFASDTILSVHLHHDFRENIIAIDKFATILSDADILNIYGVRAAEVERDELFKIEFMEEYYAAIKIKQDVERSMTKVDKDYLKSIKVEEENFVQFKYVEKELAVRFSEMLINFVKFKTQAIITLDDSEKQLIEQLDKENETDVALIDRISYGQLFIFEIDGMKIAGNDKLVEMWSNRIHKDSFVTTVTDVNELISYVGESRSFDERLNQLHDFYGQMGYTDESLDRSIESRMKDSLIQVSEDSRFDELTAKLYDGTMTDVSFYYGDYIGITIADSLHTYVKIVKKPWLFQEFDNFGHNEYPHMYNGDNDEYDITTQLREKIKLDAYAIVYDAGALVQLFERINVGYSLFDKDDNISISLVDDVKHIIDAIVFNDVLSISTNEMLTTYHGYDDLQIISVFDRIWYGYKMQEQQISVSAKDSIYYSYFEGDTYKEENLNAVVRDWLLVEYLFIDDKPHIKISDKLQYSSFGISKKDNLNIALRESIEFEELIDLNLFEKTKVYIADKLVAGSEFEPTVDLFSKDSFQAAIKEIKLTYGPGKKLKDDSLRVSLSEKINISQEHFDPKEPILNIETVEQFAIVIKSTFKDKTEIDLYERMKFGPVFRDSLDVLLVDKSDFRMSWLDDRVGVDFFPHNDGELEYLNGSADRAFEAVVADDIKAIDVKRTFVDKITTIAFDKIVYGHDDSFSSFSTIFKDSVSILLDESYDVRLSWLDERFGVDAFSHDERELEYLADSAERSITTLANDDIKIIELTLSFKEMVGILTSDDFTTGFGEQASFSMNFADSVRGLLSEGRLGINLSWSDGRIGLDAIPHDFGEMGFGLDSLSRSISTATNDDIRVIDTHMTFGESLIILSSDQLSTTDNEIEFIEFRQESITLSSHDSLTYGIGIYDHVWDYKEWEKCGYTVPYELYTGKIPHDEAPYDLLGYAEQGDNISQVSTGVTEKVAYEFNLLFKDHLKVIQTDEKHILEHWEYQSLFKDSLNTILTGNVEIGSSTITKDSRMTTAYAFNDGVKTGNAVTVFPNNARKMDYYSSAFETPTLTTINEDMKVLDVNLSFKDSLVALSSDEVNFGLLYKIDTDFIRVTSADNVEYGFGLEHVLWNLENWGRINKNEKYDSVFGKIPHDEFPYDFMEHNEQGNDLSVVDTVIYDKVSSLVTFNFKDALGVSSLDSLNTLDLVNSFKEAINFTYSEHHGIGLTWLNDRFAVDEFIHDFNEMEYLYDSSDRSVTSSLFDNVVIIDIHRNFTDRLIILSSDQIASRDNLSEGLIATEIKQDGIVVSSKDSLMYGPGRYDYIWDAKEWSGIGTILPYEDWVGRIPHDDFPYDEMEHDEQGRDLSIIGTQTKEKLNFSFDFIFKEKINISLNEQNDIGIKLPHFFDRVEIKFRETFDTRLIWLNDRYGIDAFSHDERELEYFNDSETRTITSVLSDDLKNMIISYNFIDKITAIPRDNILVRTDLTGFTDSIRATFVEDMIVGLKWPDNRFGVDEFCHNDNELEYYSDSSSRLVDVLMEDDIKLLELNLKFTDGLTLRAFDSVSFGELINFVSDGIKITTKDDTLNYGFGLFDYVWDLKEWDQFGYALPYENWSGKIPHDEIPYGEFEHSEQGNDISSISTGLTDKLTFNFDLLFKDSLSLTAKDNVTSNTKFLFGDTIVFASSEKVGVGLLWLDGRYSLDEIAHDELEMGYSSGSEERSISTYIGETMKIIDTKFVFNEKISILSADKLLSSEKIKGADFILKFCDKISVTYTEIFIEGLSWLDNRLSNDSSLHDEGMMGYSDDSMDRSITAGIFDGFALIDTHLTFKDYLTILSYDKVVIADEDADFYERRKFDGLTISSGDSLIYGAGSYDYVWDAKEWEKYGYTVPYENWTGLIPHDELPYDIMEHSEQGEDISTISTGVTESLKYDMSLIFTEKMKIGFNERVIKGINAKFIDETIGTFTKDSVIIGLSWLDERFGVDYYSHDDMPQEYFGDSIDRTVTTELFEDLNLLDIKLIFNERLSVLSNDSLFFNVSTDREFLKIASRENLQYGFGITKCVWDSGKWSDYGINYLDEDEFSKYANWYGLTPHDEMPHDVLEHTEQFEDGGLYVDIPLLSEDEYSKWYGLIPHDSIPYDTMEHNEQGNDVPVIITGLTDSLLYGYGLSFVDSLNVIVGKENATQATNFWEQINVISTEAFLTHTKSSLVINRIGVDGITHDFGEQEYIDDSLERSISTDTYDYFKVLNVEMTFSDSLTLKVDETITVGEGFYHNYDKIIISADEFTKTKVDLYSYVFDSLEFDKLHNVFSSEDWFGRVPHDTFGYDTTEHDSQGEDLSQLFTGVKDSLVYGYSYNFSDSVRALIGDAIVKRTDAFFDSVFVISSELFDLKVKSDLIVGNYGIDEVPHNEHGLDYFADSIDRTFSAALNDDIKVLDIHMAFGESLTIIPKEIINASSDNFVNLTHIFDDRIVILSNDARLSIGFNMVEYAWDAGAWDRIKENEQFESWKGFIPHDAFPYNLMEHDEQGEINAKISTGLTDKTSYFVDLKFFETVRFILDEKLKKEASILYNSFDGIITHDNEPHDQSEHNGQGNDLSVVTGLFDNVSYNIDLIFNESISVLVAENDIERTVNFWDNLSIIANDRVNTFDYFEFFDTVASKNKLLENIASSEIFDDITLLDVHLSFGDYLTILPVEKDSVNLNYDLGLDQRLQVVSNDETLLTGFGIYDYAWDAKEWELIQKQENYDIWSGKIPHDVIPMDAMSHNDQGFNFSEVNTGIFETMVSKINFMFRDIIKADLSDSLVKRSILFFEKINFVATDNVDVNASFISDIKRYGVDGIPHDELYLEYYDGSIDNSAFSQIFEDIKLIDTHLVFLDSLTILPVESISRNIDTNLGSDVVVAVSNIKESLLTGFGIYDYAWDAKEWELIQKQENYDIWSGKIPHDVIPMDALEHDEQGNDISVVSTGAFDSVTSNISMIFKDILSVTFGEKMIDSIRFYDLLKGDVISEVSNIAFAESVTFKSNVYFSDVLSVVFDDNMYEDKFYNYRENVCLVISDSHTVQIESPLKIKRYGVDTFGHDDFALEYLEGSEDKNIVVEMFEGIKVIDIHLDFSDSLMILPFEKLDFTDQVYGFNDYVVVQSLNERLNIGTTIYNYAWNTDKWDFYKKLDVFTDYYGKLPNDEFPYDLVEHDEQGKDLSNISAGLFDAISYEIDLSFKEHITVSFEERNFDKMSIYKSYFDSSDVLGVDKPISTKLKETFSYGFGFLFGDNAKVSTIDNAENEKKYNFTDQTTILTDERFASFIDSIMNVTRYGIDDFSHDSESLNFVGDSVDRLFEAAIFDDINVIDVQFTFGESLTVLPLKEMFGYDVFTNSGLDSRINIVSTDKRLEYGFGIYNYAWDAKQWNNYVETDNLELWSGKIPHDEFKFDEISHGEQGDDFSTISTGVYDNIEYSIDLFFREKINLSLIDKNHEIAEFDYSLQSFKNYNEFTMIKPYDDLKVLNIHTQIKEVLTVVPVETLANFNRIDYNDLSFREQIKVVGLTDRMSYGYSVYSYTWDAKEWQEYQTLDNEFITWKGRIPHDAFPMDVLAHDSQGNDLSIVETGVFDSISYAVDLRFTDSVKSNVNEYLDYWQYKSNFKEILHLNTDGNNNGNATDTMIRNESMLVSYSFEDRIKTHKFIYGGNGATEEISIIDRDSQQIVESIIKYRMYEKIDVQINEDILTTALFKYDDQLSLITDFKTKINLYKTDDAGNVTRSMTVIKDKTQATIELIFVEGIMTNVKEQLYYA